MDLVAGLFDDAREPDETSGIPGARPPSPGTIRRRRALKKLLDRAWHGQGTVYLLVHVRTDGALDASFGTDLQVPKGARSMIVINMTEVLSLFSSGII
jgi:hypothetical protein